MLFLGSEFQEYQKEHSVKQATKEEKATKGGNKKRKRSPSKGPKASRKKARVEEESSTEGSDALSDQHQLVWRLRR
jgi:hypothetical protein